MSKKPRTAIVGDVHGSFGHLRLAISFVLANADQIVFVGDYVNRGPDSRKVLQELINLKAQLGDKIKLLRGNHEQVLVDFLYSGDPGAFINHGGLATVKSYGPYGGSPDPFTQFRRSFPTRHRRLLEAELEDYYETPDFFVSHCGLNPDLPFSRDRSDVVFGSHPRLFQGTKPAGFPDMVVAGHYVQADGRPFTSEHFVCVDTGCGSTAAAPLTCLIMPDLRFQQFRSMACG